jgi:hypothetical protein
MSFSLTYQGVVILVLSKLFEFAGVPFVPEDAEKTVEFVLQFAGVVVVLYGRWRAGGVKWFGARK